MKTNSSNKKGGKESYIEQKLNKIGIEKLSKASEFSRRKANKVGYIDN